MPLRLLDLTLASPAENLALDEALLETAESAAHPQELLRLWESPTPAVVLGRASRYASEVRPDECARRGVSIERRASGGTAVVVGPGCLLYSLVLSQQIRPHLQGVDQIHRFVMGRMVACLRYLAPETRHEGSSDLTWRGRKFSGNALRVKKSHILYHGTLLYDFHLELISACLPENPPRQPEYRGGRSHASFVGNITASPADLKRAIIAGWEAHEPVAEWPLEMTLALTAERYSRREWVERL